MLKERSGQEWVIIDRGLLEKVARDHNLSKDLLGNQGEKNLFLDEMLATFLPHWRSEKDAFSLLSQQIMTLATSGNVIIVGRASAFITGSMKNCTHYRLYASAGFKISSISSRLNLSEDEAEKLIAKRQKQRDRFNNDFVDRDPHDMSVYNLLFNNDLNKPMKMANTIAEYVLGF